MAISEFTVKGMHCGSCGMLIDEAVEELAGVKSSQTDVRAGLTKVEHDATVTSEQIAGAIVHVGYSAEL